MSDATNPSVSGPTSGDTGIVGVDPAITAGSNEPAKQGVGRPKGNQTDYPGLFAADENGKLQPVKLESIPSDWDKAKHKMLKPSNFADEADYLQWRGEMYIARGTKMVEKAEALRNLGTKEQRDAASKLERYATKMKELREQLEASGQNPDEILALLMGSKDNDDS